MLLNAVILTVIFLQPWLWRYTAQCALLAGVGVGVGVRQTAGGACEVIDRIDN